LNKLDQRWRELDHFDRGRLTTSLRFLSSRFSARRSDTLCTHIHDYSSGPDYQCTLTHPVSIQDNPFGNGSRGTTREDCGNRSEAEQRAPNFNPAYTLLCPLARNGNGGPVSGEQGTDGDNGVDAFICGLFG